MFAVGFKDSLDIEGSILVLRIQTSTPCCLQLSNHELFFASTSHLTSSLFPPLLLTNPSVANRAVDPSIRLESSPNSAMKTLRKGKPTFQELKQKYFEDRTAQIESPSHPFFVRRLTHVDYSEGAFSIAKGQPILVSETGVRWGEAMVFSHNDAVLDGGYKGSKMIAKDIENYRQCMLAFKEGYCAFLTAQSNSNGAFARAMPNKNVCIHHGVAHFLDSKSKDSHVLLQLAPSSKRPLGEEDAKEAEQASALLLRPSKRPNLQSQTRASPSSSAMASPSCRPRWPKSASSVTLSPFGTARLLSSSRSDRADAIHLESSSPRLAHRRPLVSFLSGRRCVSRIYRREELSLYCIDGGLPPVEEESCSYDTPVIPSSPASPFFNSSFVRSVIDQGHILCGRADAFQVFGSEHVCKEYDGGIVSTEMWKDEFVRVFELLTAIEDPDADVASKKLAAALKMSAVGDGKFNVVYMPTKDTPECFFPQPLRAILDKCAFRVPRLSVAKTCSDLYRKRDSVSEEILALLEAAHGGYGTDIHAVMSISVPLEPGGERKEDHGDGEEKRHLLFSIQERGTCTVEERMRLMFSNRTALRAQVPAAFVDYMCEIQNVIYNYSRRRSQLLTRTNHFSTPRFCTELTAFAVLRDQDAVSGWKTVQLYRSADVKPRSRSQGIGHRFGHRVLSTRRGAPVGRRFVRWMESDIPIQSADYVLFLEAHNASQLLSCVVLPATRPLCRASCPLPRHGSPVRGERGNSRQRRAQGRARRMALPHRVVETRNLLRQGRSTLSSL